MSAGDGWDDDDLDFGDDGDDLDFEANEMNEIQEPKAEALANEQDIGIGGGDEGWGDDDDLDFGDEIDEIGQVGTGMAHTNVNRSEIDDIDDDVPASPIANDGWGDEDNFDFDNDDDDAPDNGGIGDASDVSAAANAPAPPSQFHNNNHHHHQAPAPMMAHVTSHRHQQLVDQLVRYVGSLSHIIPSINAVLEFEYNTPEKAAELVHYYGQREKLAEYTRNKEVPRMDYHVVLPYGHVETDKSQVVSLLSDDRLISRCANQSLLADLLQVLTGPDLLIRPQYLATCIAEWCRFTVHFNETPQEDTVDCLCVLKLSLPSDDGSRFDLAEVKSSIVFQPNPNHGAATIEYRVHTVQCMIPQSDWVAVLSKAATFLEEMDMPSMMEDSNMYAQQNAPADMFRDAFVERSGRLFNQSAEGMKSALQEMGSVVNLKQKIALVKGGVKTLSNLLPDSNIVREAEAEALAYAAQQQQQQQQYQQANRFNFGPPRAGNQPPNPSHPMPPQGAPPGRNAPARPTSILGGFVRSGWSRLSKSVAMPEDDEAIYGVKPTNNPNQQPQQSQQGEFKLYNRDSPRDAPRNNDAFPAAAPMFPRAGNAHLKPPSKPAQPAPADVPHNHGAPFEQPQQPSPPAATVPPTTQAHEFAPEAPIHLAGASSREEATNDGGFDVPSAEQQQQQHVVKEAPRIENEDHVSPPPQAATPSAIPDHADTAEVEPSPSIEHQEFVRIEQTHAQPEVQDHVTQVEHHDAANWAIIDNMNVPPQQQQQPIVQKARHLFCAPTFVDMPQYDAATDVLPTRKRWQNPRPNRL